MQDRAGPLLGDPSTSGPDKGTVDLWLREGAGQVLCTHLADQSVSQCLGAPGWSRPAGL